MIRTRKANASLYSLATSLIRTAPASTSFAGTAQFRGGITESTTASAGGPPAGPGSITFGSGQMIVAFGEGFLPGEAVAISLIHAEQGVVFNTLNQVNFIEGKERAGADLFKVDPDRFGTASLIDLIVRNAESKKLPVTRQQVKDIFTTVIGNTFFETTNRADQSRLAALPPFQSNVKSKWLKRYSHFVTSADTGAILTTDNGQ